MSDDLFNFNNQFEEALNQKLNPYEHDLKKAKIYCVRGQYENALAIYDRILEEDIENQEALQNVISNIFGVKCFVYAVSRNESVRLQKVYTDKFQVGALPKKDTVKLEFEGEE